MKRKQGTGMVPAQVIRLGQRTGSGNQVKPT
jgi:hypothetical protein